MDSTELNGLLVIGGTLLVFLIGVAVLITRFYRKVDQGHALIINKVSKDPVVTFTGGVVLPVIHRAELMDISVKAIEIDRRGKEGLICQDNIRADIKVAFFVRVNKTAEDVLKVAQAIGCQRASNQATLEQLFVAKFSEALKTVGKRLDFEELYIKRDEFKDQIIQVIGKDLNGYALEDAAIDYLEQTTLDALDPHNILDAQGIRKITAITAEQNVQTNELKQEERKAIKKKDVEAAEAILELERQEEDAKAKQQREVLTIRAREEAETAKVQAEETKKAELAKIKLQEEVAISIENKQRQVAVAQKNRERVIAVETERVEKDRQLEMISRERETELQRIDKDKALEHEKKAIADVVAARIAVEKGVAEEEERITDLRVIADAKRKKEATVIAAEATAQERLVVTIKEAEAQEQVAHFKAKEVLTLADARLEQADRDARAQIRRADGMQAESAAPGLADAKVKEADAIAIEKLGRAEATVELEKAEAAAKGRVALAQAIEREGKARADAERDMLTAQAAGAESKGMAQVRVKDADAAAVEKMGQAEAAAIEHRIAAEARGLVEKAKSLQTLQGEAREHEEFRIRLDKDLAIEKAELGTRERIAAQQAQVLGAAMQQAKINLVGGDGQFLERFFRAVSLGQSLDGAIDNSESLKTALAEYLDGKANLREDLKEVLTRPALDSGTVKNLSIAAALHQLASAAGPEQRAKIDELAKQARQLGLE